jgi:hypothetical protein
MSGYRLYVILAVLAAVLIGAYDHITKLNARLRKVEIGDTRSLERYRAIHGPKGALSVS